MSAAALTDIIQEIKWLGLPQVWSIRWVAVDLTVTWSALLCSNAYNSQSVVFRTHVCLSCKYDLHNNINMHTWPHKHSLQ